MSSSLSVGYVIGAFDMLNVAHLSVLRQVRDTCDVVVVGLLGDDQVQRETGLDPITTEVERRELLRHVRGVDDVVHHDPQWVTDHPQATVYAFSERSDVRTDVVVVPDHLPSNTLLWGASDRLVEAAGAAGAR